MQSRVTYPRQYGIGQEPPSKRGQVRMEQRDHFHAELAKLVRANYPDCSAAIIVGSYALDRPFVADIDINAFGESFPLEDKDTVRLHFEGWKLDIAARHPLWLDPTSIEERGKLLFMLRELRKLVAGIVLFDDAGSLAEAIAYWKDFQIPISIAQPFYERIEQLDLRALEPTARRSALYYGIQNMVFGWTSADMNFRYSKPKWLLWDVKCLGSQAFEDLLRGISQELCDAASPAELAARLETVLSIEKAAEVALGPTRLYRLMLRDAKFLTEHDEHLAAVWPLRMGAYELAKWKAQHLDVPYEGIRSVPALLAELERADPEFHDILSTITQATRPVPSSAIELFETARGEFRECLARKRDAAT